MNTKHYAKSDRKKIKRAARKFNIRNRPEILAGIVNLPLIKSMNNLIDCIRNARG